MAEKFVPYGRQVVDDADVAAVIEALRSDWLTTGPLVGRFEAAFASYVDARHGVATSNGTAALHLCMLAAGIGPGDEVIVPPLTFVASANCVRYVGGTPVFADVHIDTLTLAPAEVEARITAKTRAIVTVDYAGLPSDLDELMAIAARHGLIVVEDACHAIGGEYRGRRIGSIAHMTAFSFHPVKHMTTAEGGLVTTADDALAARLRRLRNHGIDSDHRQREAEGTWAYDMVELGYNYRLSDIQCALGLSQLAKVPAWLARRRAIAARYAQALAGIPLLVPPVDLDDRQHAWHLYAVRVRSQEPGKTRRELFRTLRAAGIGANVHYLPVHLHSYYRSLGHQPGECPVAERAYEELLSLPMSHALTDVDQQRVIDVLRAYDHAG